MVYGRCPASDPVKMHDFGSEAEFLRLLFLRPKQRHLCGLSHQSRHESLSLYTAAGMRRKKSLLRLGICHVVIKEIITFPPSFGPLV